MEKFQNIKCNNRNWKTLQVSKSVGMEQQSMTDGVHFWWKKGTDGQARPLGPAPPAPPARCLSVCPPSPLNLAVRMPLSDGLESYGSAKTPEHQTVVPQLRTWKLGFVAAQRQSPNVGTRPETSSPLYPYLGQRQLLETTTKLEKATPVDPRVKAGKPSVPSKIKQHRQFLKYTSN